MNGRLGRPPDGVSYEGRDAKRLRRRVVALDMAAQPQSETTVVERLHAFLAGEASERCRPLLEAAYARAAAIALAGGENSASHTTAAQVYAADVIALLAAEGELDADDTETIVGALAETCSLPLLAASLDVFLRAASSPALLELPPVVAAEIQLRLLVYLGVAADVSLWRRTTEAPSNASCRSVSTRTTESFAPKPAASSPGGLRSGPYAAGDSQPPPSIASATRRRGRGSPEGDTTGAMSERSSMERPAPSLPCSTGRRCSSAIRLQSGHC